MNVSSWVGRAPAVGDQLRSRRARYLITEIAFEAELQPGRETLRPVRLRIFSVKAGSVEGGREHPWSWDKRRGRASRRSSEVTDP